MDNSTRNLYVENGYRGRERLDDVLPVPACFSTATISAADSVLLIRLGGIGDAIRLLPTAAFLRSTDHFDGPLHCAVEPPVDRVFECTGYFDRIHSFPLCSWKSRLMDIAGRIDTVRDTVFDWVFDCHGILKSGLLSRLSRSRRRIGYHPSNAKEVNWSFQDVTISKLETELPRLLKYLQLVRPFVPDERLNVSRLQPEFERIQPVRADVRKLANKHPILVHPSSSTGRYGSKKNWGTRNFRGLITRVLDDTSRPVRITWGPGERDIAVRIAEPFSSRVQIAPDTSPITNFVYLIQQSHMMVTIDSSPVHFADLLGTPAVVIFGVGKSSVNAPFFAPYRMASLQADEERTNEIPVDRVYRAYSELENVLASREQEHV